MILPRVILPLRPLMALACAAIAAPLFAAIDLNGDGMGDIWALKYQGPPLVGSADSDGDGKSNAAESAAGTDPRSPESNIAISSVTKDGVAGPGVHLTWATVLGKGYQVQSTTSLSTPNWQPEAPIAIIAGTGETINRTFPAPGGVAKYYHVVVQDVDSDNDGVSDWEELVVGSNPHSNHSAGLAEEDDLTRITKALTAPSRVSIQAIDSAASEVGADTGTMVVVRSGGLGPIAISYAVSGSATPGVDFTALAGSLLLGLGENTAPIVVAPLADGNLESPESVIVSLSPAPTYTLDAAAIATVLISDQTGVNADGAGGLAAQYYNETTTTLSDTNPPNPPDWNNLRVSRTDPTVDFDYGVAPWPGAGVNSTYFASRWSGEVLPEYSQIYTFFLRINKGGRLWVNGELLVDNWPRANYTVVSAEYSGTIALVGGVRYSILIEHFETTGNNAQAILSWQSQNQTKQVIPQNRLFANAPPQITSVTDVTLLKGGGPFTYQIAASGFPTTYGAANLPNAPPAWTINAATGQISGSPTQAGVWQVPISATNAYGSGAAILTLTVVDTGGGITHDLWHGSFNSIAALPLTTLPAITTLVSALEVPQSQSDNFGGRLRGFITAPVTGPFEFWLTADDQAELWISNDDEVVNLFKRTATTSATGFRNWASSSAGRSPLLWLEAGKRYYIEVRHVESSGPDHVSVGWLKPGDIGPAGAPSEVVPGYALSPWSAPSGTTAEGTLYMANLTPQGTAVSNGYGLSTLRLSSDETTAYVSASYGNLTTPFSGMHVHDDRLPNGANIVFDPDEPGVQTLPDGSWAWPIVGVAGLSAQQIAQGIKNGNAYFNVHSLRNPAGEIKGFYRLQDGTQTFTPPASAPSWSAEPLNANAAARFLTQATFGPTGSEIAAVQTLGYSGWLDQQFAKTATHHIDHVMLKRNLTDPNGPTYPTNLVTNSWWKNSISADDQLRQRIAFALSQTLVVSSAGPLEDRSDALSYFYDTLLDQSFGNFRDILKAVTLTPAMGAYLDMRRNDKPNKASGRIPNENYAREILQLFSLGLNRMHPDGSLMLNSKGLPVPTYDQEVIVGFAHAFTGWDYNQPNPSTGFLPTGFNASPYVNTYTSPMKEVPERHFTGQKRILNNVVLPGLPSVGGIALDAYATHTAAPYSRTGTINDPAYQGLPALELEATHRAIFDHPNVGPFVCRQLIQRLVTSTPSRGYIYRVVEKFEDNGAGVRGDMKAVIRAILLDYEARSTALLTQQGYGKQREPLLRITALARAFPSAPDITGTYTQTNNVIAITNTNVPHLLSSGNAVNLNFTTGTPSPTDRTYTVNGTPPSANSFNVSAADILNCTYAQTGTTITVTRTAHGLDIGNTVYLDFNSGGAADGLYALTGSTTNTFTVLSPTSATIAAGSTGWLVFYTGGYTQSGNTVTVTTRYHHCLASGDNVAIDFSPVTGSTSVAADGTYAITVLDERRFTLNASDAVSRTGEVVVGPPTISLTRTGSVGGTANNWTLDGTDTYLGQTPLRSPTVFNFFEPDYQFPGLLAEAGLITPEFQLTSDTNVVRQSNFIFGGVFSSGSSTSSGSTTGLNTFRDGNGSIAMDFSPWMGNRPGSNPATLWTQTSNLGALVDELSTLLLAGQLPNTGTNNYTSNPRVVVNARQAIVDYANSLTNANATVQARDRIRAIVHLLATSPHFTIQK